MRSAVTVLLVAVLVGCDFPSPPPKVPTVPVPASGIDRIEYGEHTYVRERWCSSVSIVHDPDCKCGKKRSAK